LKIGKILFASIFVLIILPISIGLSYGQLGSSNVKQIPTSQSIDVVGTDLKVSYKIVGGQLLKTTLNMQSKSLVLFIQATNNGSLTMVLPRSLIDSQSNGQDIPFNAISGGKMTEIKGQSSSSERTLVIPFEKGARETIISGTRVIPEFGPLAELIFAIAILSVLLVFSKNSTRFVGLR